MKRFFLSIMALCMCAVMSFAEEVVISYSQLPYSEGFEKVGNTVSTAALNNTATYINYYQKATMPEGWGSYNKGGGSVATATTTSSTRQYWPYVVTNGSTTNATTTNYGTSGLANTTYKYAASGVNSLKLQGYNPSTTTASYQAYIGPAWAVMPKFDTDVTMSKLVVTGKAKIANTSTFIISVGVMTDPADITTFVELGTFGPGKGLTSAYDPIEFDVPLKNYTGTGRYVAFRTPLAPSTATAIAYLDDIYVYEAACDAPVPSIAGITDNTAQIAIDIAEGYYDIKVMEGAVAAKDVEATQGTSYDGLEDRPYTINDLQADKQYTVAARMWCDEMGSTKSVWKTISFKTLCTYATLDAKKVYYETGFETSEGFTKGSGNALPCWEVGNASGGTGTNSPYVNGSTYSQGGVSTNLYLYMSATSTYPMAYAVLPAISPENGDWSKVELSFKMTCSTTATYNRTVKIGIMNNPLDPTSFVEITEVSMDAPAKVADGWTTLVATFENKPAKATGNCIALMLNTTAASTLYIDDLSIHALADCAAPNSLEMTGVGKDTCSIMWNGKAEKQYLVKWATEKVADEDKAAYTNWAGSQVVTGPQADIKGLNPNTTYYFTIQTICDSEYSDYSAGMLAVRTECPESFSIPFYSDFNSNSAVGSGKNADCWTGLQFSLTSSSASYPYVYANKGVSGLTGDNSLYLYAGMTKNVAKDSITAYTRCYAISPELAGQDLKDCMVRFYMANTSTSTSSYYSYTPAIVVGVTTNNLADSIEKNFIPLDTIIGDRNGQVFKQYCKLNLSKYAALIPADAKYVVLKSDPRAIPSLTPEEMTYSSAYYYSYALVDNFEVTLPPCCVEPSISFNAKSSQSLTVNIAPFRATDSQWQLAAVAVNAPSDTLYFTANATTYEMTGLQPGTIYNIYARTYCESCGAGVYSDWTEQPLQARTKDYFVDSYFFGFEKEEGYNIPEGASTSYFIHPAIEVGVSKTTSNAYSAKPYQYENTTTYEYAKTGKAAMRIYSYNYYYSGEGSSATYYLGQYIILPALDECSAQKRSIRFNYRQGYNYPLNYSTTSSQGKMQGQVTKPLFLQLGLIPKGAAAPTEENFILLQEFNPQDLTGKVVTEDEKFWETMIYNITQDQALNYQVCIWWPQEHAQSSSSDASWYVYLDDVQMTDAVPFDIPVLKSVIPADVSVSVTWDSVADPMNVYVFDGGTKVAEALNVTDNKVTVSGLSASTSYVLKVVDANVPSAMEKVATVTREFTTECEALVVTDENPVLFTFDENISKTYPTSTAAADSVYWSPDCWYITNPGSSIGTTKYYNWLIQRQGYSYSLSPTPSVTYDNYNFGMKDSLGNATNSLRLYGTSSTGYKPAYAALPRVKGNINEYVLDFYFRPASLNGSGKIATISSEKKFYIVAMSDVTDFSTADTIYTVEYPETLTTSLAGADDPKGLEYWREFVVALDKADANDRIAFVQEGLQTCYLYVDNVMIRKPGANEVFIPQNLSVENITKESATLTWESSNVGATYLLTVLEGEEEILLDEPVNGLSYNLTGLSANTKYKFYVKAVKGEYSSDASGAAEFNTSCPTYGLDDFVFSFETDENLIDIPGSTTSIKQNSCWVYENLGSYTSVSSTYWPYNIKSGTTVYSHSGDYALKLYASRNTSNDTLCMTRVISPEIENASQIFAQKVLKIYYRPITHNATTKAVAQGYNGANYGKGFIVGTCSNPEDESTFVTLDTIYYTKNPTTAEMNEEGDFGWMKAFVKLDQAVGNHIWMKTLLKDTVASVYAYGGMYIDDISFTDPMPILTTAVNDATMGKVTAGDAYEVGAYVTVEATPNYNYAFVNWSDGSTENPYTFQMPATDYTITANFAKKDILLSDLEGESFEDETAEGDVRWVRVPGATSDTYRQIAGWTYGNNGTGTTVGTSWSYNVAGTYPTSTGAGTIYGHSGKNALTLYATGIAFCNYAVSPKISDPESMAGKQIEFYICPSYCSNGSTGAMSTTYVGATYSKSVVVGTCSDPSDISTFHPIKTVTYQGTISSTSKWKEQGDFFEKAVASLASVPAGDSYIYFMASKTDADGKSYTYDRIYIDDIAFGAAQPAIKVESADQSMGTVTGSGSYDMGSEVEITATPVYNHSFVQWNDGNTNASRTITVEGDATYTATFALNTFNAADINETFEAEEGGAQRWTFLPGSTSTSYKATIAWTYGNIGTGTVGGSWPYNYASTSSSKYSYEGTYAAKLYATSTTYCNYIVTPKIEDYATAFDEAQFSFYMKPTYTATSTGKESTSYIAATYAKSVIVGVATDPNDVSTFTPVDTITYDVPGFSGTAYTENPSADNNYNWHKVTVNLKNNKAPYVYIMASRTNASGTLCTYDNMYIDNVSFIAPVTVTVETEDALKGSAVVVGDATVEVGQNVTIKAVPEDTYVFAAWKQGETVVSNDAEYTFALTKNETYTATFKKDTLTIQVTTEGNGTVNINGAGTEAKVEKYTSLTLNAVADQGYQFVQWSDGNQDNPRQVSATEDKAYMAEFAAASVKVLVYVDAESAGMGAVAATGEGPAVNMYYVGETVTMTATANEGYVFDQWNDGNTQNPRQITASQDSTFYASFKLASVSISVASAGNGTAVIAGFGQSANVEIGTELSLVATANAQYKFSQWNDGNTDNPRAIIANESATYTATFEALKRDTILVDQAVNIMATHCNANELQFIEGAEFYQPESYNASAKTITFVQVESTEAGYGYLIIPKKSVVTAVKNGDAQPARTDAPNGMRGVLGSEETVELDSTNNCAIYDQKLVYIEGYVIVKPGRAYIVLDKITGDVQAPARARRITLGSNSTNTPTNLGEMVLLNNSSITKFIINGQMVIMKNGKLYNAQGQEL